MAGSPSGFPVVVVGAGQAGLAVSHELTAHGIEHLVLEGARIGQTWQGLWDSFRLVTPNWTMCLPGAAATGDDPEGFVPRDEIVRYLQRSASTFGAPDREGVGVDSLEPGPNGGCLLGTSAGQLHAGSVVVCTGAYQRPHRPDVAAGFPHDVQVIDLPARLHPLDTVPGVRRHGLPAHRRRGQHGGPWPVLLRCHFLPKRKSSVLFGVGEDAAIVAQTIAGNRSQHGTAPTSL